MAPNRRPYRFDGRSVRRGLVVFTTFTWIAACGYVETDTTRQVEQSNEKKLIGSWQTGCIETSLTDYPFVTERLDFGADGSLVKTITRAANSTCEGPGRAVVTILASYRLGHAFAGREGLQTIDYVVNEVSITPASPEIAEFFNTIYYCGATDWRSGVARSAVGLDCEGEAFAHGRTVHDLIEIRGDELRAGNALVWFDKLSPGPRPSAVEGERVYHRR